MNLKQWFTGLVTGTPHLEIKRCDNQPYLLRWYLLPENRFFRVYLHKFVGDDEREAMHDHPRASFSILFRGRYREITPVSLDDKQNEQVRIYRAISFIYRRAEHIHRVELIDGKPAWTVFMMGRKRREWGFWFPDGFKHWTKFRSEC